MFWCHSTDHCPEMLSAGTWPWPSVDWQGLQRADHRVPVKSEIFIVSLNHSRWSSVTANNKTYSKKQHKTKQKTGTGRPSGLCRLLNWALTLFHDFHKQNILKSLFYFNQLYFQMAWIKISFSATFHLSWALLIFICKIFSFLKWGVLKIWILQGCKYSVWAELETERLSRWQSFHNGGIHLERSSR